MIKGQIIGGEFGKIIIRQKFDKVIELGELLVAQNLKNNNTSASFEEKEIKDKKGTNNNLKAEKSKEDSDKYLLQVNSLFFSSQISSQNLELISGINLEEESNVEFMQDKLRNYNMAIAKNLITINNNSAKASKSMPKFFSLVREATKDDFCFITSPSDPLYIGNSRSGSKEIDFPIYLSGKKALSHHVLIGATTGRGKSNLVSSILWHTLQSEYCGFLVLDPHDEYFGRSDIGLKDHQLKDKLVYYTAEKVPVGGRTLKVNIKLLRPEHFSGVINFSDPQRQALSGYYKKYKEKWIEAIILEEPLDIEFFEGTISVIKRKLVNLLDIDIFEDRISASGVFDLSMGESTILDICKDLESSKTVIIDTSSFSGQLEILIGSMITSEIFSRYKKYKINGINKPVISIVIEEAPRVIGKEVLEKGSNIFETIAREGRKFNVGLMAITQLPSLIPRQILANINTKIILGIEMMPERQAIIESCAQDLSSDSQAIASLDVGEAIVSSNFAKFALPVKIPFFKNIARVKKENIKFV